MTGVFKRLVRRLARPAVNQLELAVGSKLVNNEVVAQKLLALHYRELAATGSNKLPKLSEVGFRKYSQFEEDGMLLHIFALVPRSAKSAWRSARVMVASAWWRI